MTTKIIIKILCSLIIIASLTACTEKSIEGAWIEPVSGMKEQTQGILLKKGGIAHSINMATLQYEQWELKSNMLILSGKSLGNGQTISFTEAFTIVKLTKNELVLKKDGLFLIYRRQ